MTKDTFKKGMAIFTAAVYKFELNKEQAQIWFRLLEDMSDDLFLTACEIAVNTCSNIYPGTVIVALIREQAQKLRAAQVPLPAEAWLEVKKNITRVENGKAKWSHPAIKQAVDSIGQTALYWMGDECGQPEAVLRGQFLRLYGDFRLRATGDFQKALEWGGTKALGG